MDDPDVGISYSAGAGAGLEDIDDLMEEIEASFSPSPPERIRARNAQYIAPRFTRNPGPQTPLDYDDISDYDDVELYQAFEPQFQPDVRLTGSSSYGPPTLSRRPFATQSVARLSFRQTVPPGVLSAHNTRPPMIPGLLSTSDRLAPHANEAPHDNRCDPARGSNPRNAHGIPLRPVSKLPDMYRSLFKFGVFNAVQSSCFDTVMDTDENMVISAPTGSGKTVLFELAIIRMLMQAGGNTKTSKCIYVAPTKALCSEKCRDWTAKFQPLGVDCCELTGDTVHFGKSAWGSARDATIIVTTGEKWDSLTRNWSDHQRILSQIQLFLVDEVQILNEHRGSTLEVVISRMKIRGSSVRFVVVSATVPNIEDVASWISNGTPDGSATIMKFGEEYRPCKLSKFVYGIPRKREQNDFVFQKTLDYRLYAILQQHSANKPMLVFCSTRKGVMTTAEQIMKEYEEASHKKQTLPWLRPPRIEQNFQNKRLEKLAVCGIGVHHAGISMEDRRTTEELYIKKVLRIVFATSTLAVGVNLPAHTVVIKGVKIFQNNTSQEYSDLDIMQMMGRAGRPQFDKEGIAIIMCEADLEAKYKALAQGHTVLESCLHLNLSEHINSEVGLGTITDLDTAKEWLHNSFLYRRVQRNPRHYAIGKDNSQTWQQRIDDMVTQSIIKLQDTELVTYSEHEDGQLCSTEFGDIMSKFYVKQSTMNLILKLPDRATVREILEAIASAEEFSDIRLRSGEKQVYNKMRVHNDIRYQIKKIEKPADKIFVLIQAVLGCMSLSDPEYKNGDNNPPGEAFAIFRHVARIAKAIVEVAIVKKAGGLLKSGLEAMRCLNAKAWEDRYTVMRQVERIGEKSLKVLAEHNITSIDALRKADQLCLEALLNRRPPFGLEVLAAVQQFPQYTLKISEVAVSSHGGKKPVEVEILVDCGLLNATEIKPKKVKTRVADMTAVLTLTSDLDFVDFRRIPTKVLKETKSFSVSVQLTKPSQSITVCISSEIIAGVAMTECYKPNIGAKHYPTMVTRPQNSLDVMLEGLEDDPDFWNMGPDDEDFVEAELPTAKVEPPAVTSKPAATQASLSKHHEEQQKTSAKIAPGNTAATMQNRLKRLPNGNYECNHMCKDKRNCRHVCCHEGLPKPPPMSKKRIEALCTEESSQNKLDKSTVGSDNGSRHTDSSKAKATTKVKSKPCDKAGAQLKRLDALHEKTNVKANLKLSPGQRIKLDKSVNTSGEGLKGRSIGSGLTSLRVDNKADTGDDVISIDDSDNDADLPEPSDLLNSFGNGKRKGCDVAIPSDDTTHYSNSEVDAALRDAPLYDNENIRHMNTSSSTPQAYDNSPRAENWLWNTPASKRQKRRSEADESPINHKRAELEPTQRDETFRRPPASPMQRKVDKGKQKAELLFLDSSSDEHGPSGWQQDVEMEQGSPCRFQAPGDEPFELDLNLFEIVPDTSSSETLATSCSASHEQLSLRDHIEVEPSSFAFDDEPQEDNSFQKDLEELEAWWHSGAVEIIDD
ncbi:P-loop containing nucleoside triphosphate hydrolase protein [Laetiporus sulphureus 93-53]|uniref:DNA 3'-5' helicase n=1 Tax=Laetiporus sulphureus 93-53 TaxID=1314785 RepID=A0A165C721_9APHY|nr:P-loop containing nucleoside triphosphate hydrolase protein [Laetiporus sulphureus 93-53]KZT02310.1 P-loop containing nucleoside triphosphate hydrolase protein [Laetiporus sulphureus 93-53]